MRELLVALIMAGGALAQNTTVGPARGSLVIVGGGAVGPAIVERFLTLAGGKDAPIVIIPTADEGEPAADLAAKHFLARAGATRLTVLHTRDPKVADTAGFVEPIRNARAVWINGGRQWRLADAYLDTRVTSELFALLERGGVIGGSSAGATIQGSYLVRGAPEGNTVMMAPGHERGMGFLRQSAIDQHLLTRKREKDLIEVVRAHPELLGIGIDESTAIVVQGDQFEVIGKSKVAIYRAGAEPPYFFLGAGERFDLKTRRR